MEFLAYASFVDKVCRAKRNEFTSEEGNRPRIFAYFKRSLVVTASNVDAFKLALHLVPVRRPPTIKKAFHFPLDAFVINDSPKDDLECFQLASVTVPIGKLEKYPIQSPHKSILQSWNYLL